MAALPHLRREGRGVLVHVTSAIARRAFPLQSAYAAAKRGTEGFLEGLRVELRHDRVPMRVTNAMPLVATDDGADPPMLSVAGPA
jgi:NAD(P)-dependent dehydrogenase (short-subunit alcohol dehydrogenase family)